MFASSKERRQATAPSPTGNKKHEDKQQLCRARSAGKLAPDKDAPACGDHGGALADGVGDRRAQRDARPRPRSWRRRRRTRSLRRGCRRDASRWARASSRRHRRAACRRAAWSSAASWRERWRGARRWRRRMRRRRVPVKERPAHRLSAMRNQGIEAAHQHAGNEAQRRCRASW